MRLKTRGVRILSTESLHKWGGGGGGGGLEIKLLTRMLSLTNAFIDDIMR